MFIGSAVDGGRSIETGQEMERRFDGYKAHYGWPRTKGVYFSVLLNHLFCIYIHAAAGGTSSKSNFSLAILEILESVTMEMALTLTM